MSRPTRDDYFNQIALVVSTRATCPRRSVGAVLVSPDHYILATGYNGSLPGTPHCLEVGCLMEDNHCQRAIHGEVNAIAQAAKRGISLEGSRLYLYTSNEMLPPCRECTKVLLATGVDLSTAYPYNLK